jgi:hypothetical protein
MVEHKVEPMLNITLHDVAGQLSLELEGRLAGAWVCEVEQCWHTVKASHPNRKFSIDLTGVTYIDRAGRYLLRLMSRDGVSFVASGLMVQDIFDQITGSTE